MALNRKKLDLLLGLNLREFFAATKKASAQFSKVKTNIEKHPINVKHKGTQNLIKQLGLVAAGYMAVRKTVTDLTTSQTNMANVASLGVKNIGELTAGVEKIAQDVAVPIHDLETGLYQVVSAGVDAADQLTVLESAGKAAKAGLAETTDAINLGSAVIKGYGLEWSQFDDVMDLAFQTVKLGQTTFPELSASMGKVIPMANTLGISLEEVFGAYATLTGVTGNAAEVTTQIRGILAATVKPTDELTQAFKEYGGAQAAIKQLGLGGYLAELQKKTDGNAQAMTKFVPRVEGLNAVLAAAGAQYDTFIKKTEAMTNRTGAMNDAYAIQAETLDSKLTKLDNSFQVFSKTILNKVVPAVTDMMDAGTDALKWFNDLDESTQNAIITFGLLSAVLIKMPAIIRGVSAAINSLKVAMGPAGWVVLGLGVVATAFIENETAAERAARALEYYRGEVSKLSFSDMKNDLDEINKKIDEQVKKIMVATESGPSLMDTFLILAFNGKNANPYFVYLDGLLAKLDEYNAKKQALTEGLGIDREMTETDIYGGVEGGISGALAAGKPTPKAKTTDLEKYNNALKAAEAKRAALEATNKEKETKTIFEQAADDAAEMTDRVEIATELSGDKITAFAESSADLLSNAFVNPFDEGITVVENFGRALGKMIANFASQLASKSIIFGFLNIISGGAINLGSFTKFLGFSKGGQVDGFDSGGLIGPGSITPSAFIPPGEDGLIAAQVGEMVMNRQATQKFFPILEEMNRLARQGYAAGGVVTPAGITAGELNQIVDAIRGIKIEIAAEMDAIQFFRKNYPKYEKLQNKYRVI